MNSESNFRELFQILIEQYQLSPEIAQKLLQRILQILTEGIEESSCTQSNTEREVPER